jgi:hypothetical protein
MPNVEIPLDYSREEIRHLFSHPANCNEVCFVAKTLEETITHYVNLSLRRDGYNAEVQAVHLKDGARKCIVVAGADVQRYRTLVPDLLRIGQIGLKISKALPKALELRDKGWRYNWRFFLPLGVAMAEHDSVQLLHFPPDSVLERDQDYLAASTTKQWGRLLAENLPGGVADGESDGQIIDRTARYQNIIDLAPIAAPSSDGKNIDTVYEDYSPYFLELMKLWLKPKNKVLPMVAFGLPVREWIQKNYDLRLDVHSVASIEVADGIKVPVLGSNHPSFIFNADDKYQDNPRTPVNERLVGLMLVLWEDLVTAYWQVHMAKTPTADAAHVLENGRKEWSRAEKLERLAQLVQQLKLAQFLKHQEDFGPAVEEMKDVIRTPRKLAEYREKLRKMSKAVGSLDSRSRKAIELNKTGPLTS